MCSLSLELTPRTWSSSRQSLFIPGFGFQRINSAILFSILIDSGNDLFMLISQCESNILCAYLHNEINLAEVYTGLKKYAPETKANTSKSCGTTKCLRKALIRISAKNLQLLLQSSPVASTHKKM